LAGIGWHSLGIQRVILLPLLSFSAKMAVPSQRHHEQLDPEHREEGHTVAGGAGGDGMPPAVVVL
jgi:hypothetical protein